MRRRAPLWATIGVVAAGCSDANLAEPEGLGLQAAEYLNYALDVMELNSIKKHEIDWPAFRETALEDAGNAKTPADTYDAIRGALERIGDNHSFFRPPGGQQQSPSSDDPVTELIRTEVGYVEVPAFSGGGPAADDLAALYHALIEEVDTLGVCRWVIDLRGNTGGNMWPMLAGVGPILGEGNPGFFVYPDSVVTTWFYEMGGAGIEATTLVSVEDPYELQGPAPPVAVLTDSLTASSGEAVAVAFRGRADTRSFGSATFGVSTANAVFVLSDGAVIFLTVATLADRDGTLYGGKLEPDSAVAGSKTGDRATDAALDAAVGWLEGLACN
jgi:carboxyl-terminal processing protease